MSTLEYIIVFSLIGSIGSLVGGIILIQKEKFTLKISHFISSFAAGVLLGTAFFDLLPEAIHEGEKTGIDGLFWALIGIIIFFLLERFIHWFHHHEDYHEHEKESKSTLPLIIISDTAHNFIDGVIIAATFMANTQLGIATALAVFAHELPQEIGDFGLMLHKGMKKKKIILVNILSATVSVIGAVGTYILGDTIESSIPILLALTAGFFIYIATSDLIPEIHYEKRKGFAIIESLLLIIGAGVVFVTITLLGHAH